MDTDVAQDPALRKRSKILEDQICNWEPPASRSTTNNDVEDSGGDSLYASNAMIMNSIVSAIHRALIIYFYRRVRNVNPIILQEYVVKTISLLLLSEEYKVAFNLFTTGIVWPAFIAACEALSEELQTQIMGWFRKIGQWSGLRNFEIAGDADMEVWKARRVRKQVHIQWLDVLREREIKLFLT